MITTGVTGGRWRASVTPWGAVEPWDGSPALDWHVAADDRWHTPRDESAVRQKRLGGTAVVETRVRIPEGDAVQRVHSVADHGGLTVVPELATVGMAPARKRRLCVFKAPVPVREIGLVTWRHTVKGRAKEALRESVLAGVVSKLQPAGKVRVMPVTT